MRRKRWIATASVLFALGCDGPRPKPASIDTGQICNPANNYKTFETVGSFNWGMVMQCVTGQYAHCELFLASRNSTSVNAVVKVGKGPNTMDFPARDWTPESIIVRDADGQRVRAGAPVVVEGSVQIGSRCFFMVNSIRLVTQPQ
jgi:hypothetical protein